MPGRSLRHALLTALVLSLLGVPCRAAEPSDIVRLESHAMVTTWEEAGLRVFVAENGATVRQGDVRLVAPRMVAWLDKGAAEPVGQAVVQVYAEGIAGRDGALRRPVALVEDGEVTRHGAAFVGFRSDLSFVWDCPLRKLNERSASPLLVKAEGIVGGLEDRKLWDQVPEAAEPVPLEAVRRTLSADQVEAFWEEEQVVFVYAGDVHGSYGNLFVRADEAVLWYDRQEKTYEIYARGSVRVEPVPGAQPPPAREMGQAADVFRVLKYAAADELYVNPDRARGLATDVELRVGDPEAPEDLVYVFRGKEAYLIDSQTLAVSETSVTTCRFARPHYRLYAERTQVVSEPPSTFLDAWNAELQVGEGKRKLLWLPFVGTDLTERAFLLTEYALGSSDKFGFFVQTTWRPLDLTTPPPWVEDWTVNLDYYADRGPAIGSELYYGFTSGVGSRHEGMVRGYYVRDTGDEDDTDLPVPKENRGRFHARHRWQVNRDWRVDGELYWLSDEGFLNEYFEEDFEDEKTPESYLLARYLRNSTYLALLYKGQVNDFLNQIEETPSATLEFLGMPVGRLVYDGTAQAGYYDRELSDLFTPAPRDAPGLSRLHTEQRVSLPFTLGIFRLDPSVRAVGTWASDSAWDGTSFGGSESRTGVGAGITGSTTFSRVFSATSELFNLNRLRHVVIPHAGIETLSTSGADSADFIQMDEVDVIDSGTVATVGLRQRLQTKRRRAGQWESVNWVELDVAYVNQSSDSVMTALDEDFVRADFEMLLTDHISLHSRDNRFGLDDLPDVVNVGATLDWLPRWALDLDYDRIEDVSSTVTASLQLPLSARYLLLLYQQYEFDSAGTGDDQNLETRLVVRRLLDQWVLDLGIHHEEANDEFAVIFGFGPRGWGLYKDLRRAGR